MIFATLTRRLVREVHQGGEQRAGPLSVHRRSVRGGEEAAVLREYGARLDVLRERPQVGQHAVESPHRPATFRHSISHPLFTAKAGIISDALRSPPKSLTEAPDDGIFSPPGAISSAGERCLHTAEVAGSNPASPTRGRPANGGKTEYLGDIVEVF